MMAVIQVNCPNCKNVVELGPSGVWLQSGEGKYGFVCPSCSMDVTKIADDKIVELLMAGGVVDSKWGGTLLSPPPVSPPVDIDEVIDFHESLKDDDALEAELDAIFDELT